MAPGAYLNGSKPNQTERQVPNIAQVDLSKENAPHAPQRNSAAGRTEPWVPPDFPLSVDEEGSPYFLLNLPLKFVLSEFVCTAHLPLHEFVELVRMQTKDDYRPKKDIMPSVFSRLCRHYKHRATMEAIAREGVRI